MGSAFAAAKRDYPGGGRDDESVVLKTENGGFCRSAGSNRLIRRVGSGLRRIGPGRGVDGLVLVVADAEVRVSGERPGQHSPGPVDQGWLDEALDIFLHRRGQGGQDLVTLLGGLQQLNVADPPLACPLPADGRVFPRRCLGVGPFPGRG